MDPLVITEEVATWNAPPRAGLKPRVRGFQRLADQGVSVIGGQEIPDADAKRLCPKGYRRHRPGVARSEVVYWSPKIWKCLNRGKFKISSPKAPADRFIVWVHLRHRVTGEERRFGVAHLVAFKTSKNGEEFKYQAARVAKWMSAGPRRVLLCDANASPGSRWLRDVEKVATAQTPETRSGPKGQFIDLILVNNAYPRARHAKALSGYPGDHKPVIAYLPVQRPPKR